MLTSTGAAVGPGPGVPGEGARPYFEHACWTRGFRAYIVIYPRLGEPIVMMTNECPGFPNLQGENT